jgi:hypothetical protein
MKITTADGLIKSVPAHLSDVAKGFNFTSVSIRLTNEERRGLLKAKCKKAAKDYFSTSSGTQDKYVYSLMDYDIESVKCITRRSGEREHCIVIKGQEIRVPYSVFKYWPEIEVVELRGFEVCII